MLIDFITFDLLLAAAVVLVSGIVRGFSGFGSGMIMAAALSAIFGPATGVPIVVLLEGLVSFQLVHNSRKDAQWKTVGILSLAACLVVPLGAYSLTHVDPELLRYGISAFILLFILLMLSGFRHKGKPTLPGMLVTGALSGFGAGISGIGGPPVILYFLSGKESTVAIRANLIAFFLVIDLTAILVYAFSGILVPDILVNAMLLLPVFLLGAWIGSHLFSKASEKFYRRAAMIVISAIAVGSPFL